MNSNINSPLKALFSPKITLTFRTGSSVLFIVGALFNPQTSKADDVSPLISAQSSWSASAIQGALFGTTDIQTETVLFIDDPTVPGPVGRLAFIPEEILAAKRLFTGENFRVEEISIIPGTNLIRSSAVSPIPVVNPVSLYLSPGGTDFTCNLNFARCSLFPDFGIFTISPNQIEITYRTSERLKFAYPSDGLTRLRRLNRMLRSHQQLKIAVVGDSISVGGDTSGQLMGNVDVHTRFPKMPSTPGYAAQFISRLRTQFQGNIEWQNFSKGGYTSDLILDRLDLVSNYSPDLTIIAFGTNDVFHKLSVERYTKNIQALIDKLRDQDSRTEIILVSSFVNNPEWEHHNEQKYRDFLAALNGIANSQRGIAVADVTTLSLEVLKRKRYFDLSSNALNHPNDWGHRLYADVLMSLTEFRGQ